MPRAQSVVDVILGEAASGSPQQRYNDMVAIASAMVNRARQTGVDLADVVSVPSQFNAYGRSLPAGVEAYRTMAERALSDVLQGGPTHNGTFYATPAARGNLPRGLEEVTRTGGHIYYSDPQNRSIATTGGYRTPSGSQAMAYDAVPTPRPAEAAIEGLLGRAESVQSPAAVSRGMLNNIPSEAPRVASFDTSRFGTMPNTEFFDRGRFGVESNVPMGGLAQALGEQRAGLLGMAPTVSGGAGVGAGVSASGGLLASPQSFDNGRFGSSPKTGRLSAEPTPEEFAREVDEYRASIGKAPVNAGLLSPTPAAPMNAYADPVVSAQPQAASAIQQQSFPARPASPMQQRRAEQPLITGLQARNLLGGIAGGLLGGFTLGPMGALAGGLLGRETAARSYFPSAPASPVQGPGQQSGLGHSYDDLNDRGRDTYNSSGQFQDAVNSGRGGLW